jgi:hypothetical protein
MLGLKYKNYAYKAYILFIFIKSLFTHAEIATPTSEAAFPPKQILIKR